MKEKITWFWNWEKRIWDDKVEANRYFATLSIMFVAVMWACVGGGRIFHEWFNWDTDTNVVAVGALLILIWGYNLAESIVASKTAMTALWRSLLVLVCLVGFFAFGVVASVVVIVLVIGYLILLVVSGVLSAGGKSGRGGLFSDQQVEQYGYDENGSQHTMRNIGGGYARDDYGRRWKNAGGSNWEKDE